MWVTLKSYGLLTRTTTVFDNWRVLHGRNAFEGVRRICGGYSEYNTPSLTRTPFLFTVCLANVQPPNQSIGTTLCLSGGILTSPRRRTLLGLWGKVKHSIVVQLSNTRWDARGHSLRSFLTLCAPTLLNEFLRNESPPPTPPTPPTVDIPVFPAEVNVCTCTV